MNNEERVVLDRLKSVLAENRELNRKAHEAKDGIIALKDQLIYNLKVHIDRLEQLCEAHGIKLP